MKTLVVAGLALALALPARADDARKSDREIDPLFFQIGLGVALRGEADTAFDSTLRLGYAWPTSRWLHPGAFLELHSYDLDTFDLSIGAQVQVPLTELARLQLRAGVGAGAGDTHALAGVQVGQLYVGGSITARRSFDTGELAVSFDIELSPLAILIAAIVGRYVASS